jgi:hypothetical protein
MVAVPTAEQEGSKLQNAPLEAEIEKAPTSSSKMSSNTDKNRGDDSVLEARRPKAKSVTFYPGVSVRECLHINNFTDEEILNAWYKKQDFQRIKMAFVHTVQQVANGTWPGDTEQDTARGLEFRHREGAMKRKVNKLNGLMAVLDEQERQWQGGYDDDEAIASAYIAVSAKALVAVRLLAARDEADVREMWADDIDTVSTKFSTISVDVSAKRPGSSLDHDERKKKTRLKQFMKKIQNVQRATQTHASPKTTTKSAG